MMNYRTEFPNYDGDFFLPENWDDNSWHNNACPHAERQSDDGLIVACIWQEYTDFTKRDTESEKRYIMTISEDDEVFFESSTDDIEEVKRFVADVNQKYFEY